MTSQRAGSARETMTSRLFLYTCVWIVMGSGFVGGQMPIMLIAVNTTEQYISSTNYPAFYPSTHEQSWLITANDSSSVINMEVKDSRLQQCTQCSCDFVAVYDGRDKSADLLKKFCDKTEPTVTSTGDVMLVLFRSDASVENRGFKAAVIEVKALEEEEGFGYRTVIIVVSIVVFFILWTGCATKKRRGCQRNQTSASVKPAQRATTQSTTGPKPGTENKTATDAKPDPQNKPSTNTKTGTQTKPSTNTNPGTQTKIPRNTTSVTQNKTPTNASVGGGGRTEGGPNEVRPPSLRRWMSLPQRSSRGGTPREPPPPYPGPPSPYPQPHSARPDPPPPPKPAPPPALVRRTSQLAPDLDGVMIMAPPLYDLPPMPDDVEAVPHPHRSHLYAPQSDDDSIISPPSPHHPPHKQKHSAPLFYSTPR